MDTVLLLLGLVLAAISILLYRQNSRLRKDELTGLDTRQALHRRRRKVCLTDGVILIDLNDFKLINDRFGHQKGDECLKQVADRLGATCRQGDILMRWGGDEFVVILHHVDLVDVEILARRIEENCAPIPLAIGIAVQTDPLLPLDQLIDLADKAMYADKATKKLV